MPPFKYAHLADLHLGSWREEKMRDLSTQAFLQAMDLCVEKQVNFILFAGDIFNTALPAMDTLKIVTKKLKELHTRNIPVYVIAGSHDFSPSGKTMIDVLEHAGLLHNVCKGSVDPDTKQLRLQFTTDAKTGAKITGILGRKGQLDRSYYENLHLDGLEQEPGYKIFMFHTTIAELKPPHLQEIESQPASFLPKGFNYYAGGHIHHRTQVTIPEYGTITYPGALFPNNFAEIEKYGHGGFYLVEVPEPGTQNLMWLPIKVIKHNHLELDCSHLTPERVQSEIMQHFHQLDNQSDISNSLITIRLHGTLENGKVSDLHFQDIFQQLTEKGAYYIMKNTAKLSGPEFSELKLNTAAAPEQVEEQLVREHLQQMKIFPLEQELELTLSLLRVLNTTKREGETVADFQQRVGQELQRTLPP